MKEQKAYIRGFFNNNKDTFIDYHKQIDNNEYLEIKEDKEKYRLEIGQKIIRNFFESKGIINTEELKINPNWIDEIINELIQDSNLTLRQIAKITGLSVSMVYKKSIGKQ